MAYMSQEKKSKIAADLKKALKGVNIKYSLSVRNHSTIVMTIYASEFDFFNDVVFTNYTLLQDSPEIAREKLREQGYLHVNPYWYHEHFVGRSKKFFELIFPILNKGNHDRSDIMTDYFDVGWYVDVNIGKWNKAYILR